MIFTTTRSSYLAFFIFAFTHMSYAALAKPLHTIENENQNLSINSINASSDAVTNAPEDCNETAYAFLNNDDDPLNADNESQCFIPQFSRWGWTTFLDFSEESGQSSYNLDFFAGAGQCDLSKGADVGSVTVTYNLDSTVTFYYNLEGYVLSEAHIYIGTNEYPTNNNGAETVAPGQYTFTDSDFGEVYNYSATIPVEGTVFYVIVHGATMEEGCSDNGDDSDDNDDSDDGDDDENDCEDSDNDGICDINDICPGYDDTIDSDGDGIPDGCDNGVYNPNSFKVYLAPSLNEVNVKYAFNYATSVHIEVFNITGTKLTEFKNSNYLKGTLSSAKFNLNHISNQILFVRLTTDKKQFSKKVISLN